MVFTAAGDDVDFVSRVFHPKLGIGEDPVCGSAHCELVPYWAEQLGKTTLIAQQLSGRRGDLECTLVGDSVHLKGQCSLYLSGQIQIS